MEQKNNAFERKYGEYAKGWNNELKQSGWGKKFNEPLTPERVWEFQLEFACELIKCYMPFQTEISQILDDLKQLMNDYGREENVRFCYKVGNTPGMWAYLVFFYFEG